MKPIASLIVLVFFAHAAKAQDLLSRIKQIEDNNSLIASRLSVMESKIDAISVKLDNHIAVMAAARPAALTPQASGQWSCSLDGVCRWIPAPGTTSSAREGYEWQWLNGAACMVPLGWGGYSANYGTCGPAGYGVSYGVGYGGVFLGGADASASAGGGCLSKLFSKFRARRAARRAGGSGGCG